MPPTSSTDSRSHTRQQREPPASPSVRDRHHDGRMFDSAGSRSCVTPLLRCLADRCQDTVTQPGRRILGCASLDRCCAGERVGQFPCDCVVVDALPRRVHVRQPGVNSPSAASAISSSIRSDVMAGTQSATELLEAAAHPTLDRAERKVEPLGDLGVAVTVDERHLDHDPLIVRQLGERTRHPFGIERRDDRLVAQRRPPQPRRRPARSIRSRCDCSVRTRSTARRRAIVTAHVDTLALVGSKRAAVRHSSTNTSWVTSSDIDGITQHPLDRAVDDAGAARRRARRTPDRRPARRRSSSTADPGRATRPDHDARDGPASAPTAHAAHSRRPR